MVPVSVRDEDELNIAGFDTGPCQSPFKLSAFARLPRIDGYDPLGLDHVTLVKSQGDRMDPALHTLSFPVPLPTAGCGQPFFLRLKAGHESKRGQPVEDEKRYTAPMAGNLRMGSALVLVLAALILSACHPVPGKLTVVTGKTVYGDLALEGVRIEVSRRETSGWRYHSDTMSGYHGSFRLHLPPGTYLFQARTMIRMGDDELALAGTLENLIVKEPGERMDRIVVEMNPDAGSGQ